MAHHEPPHLDLPCLQTSFLLLSGLKQVFCKTTLPHLPQPSTEVGDTPFHTFLTLQQKLGIHLFTPSSPFNRSWGYTFSHLPHPSTEVGGYTFSHLPHPSTEVGDKPFHTFLTLQQKLGIHLVIPSSPFNRSWGYSFQSTICSFIHFQPQVILLRVNEMLFLSYL